MRDQRMFLLAGHTHVLSVDHSRRLGGGITRLRDLFALHANSGRLRISVTALCHPPRPTGAWGVSRIAFVGSVKDAILMIAVR